MLIDFVIEFIDILYFFECCKLWYCYVGFNYKFKVNDYFIKYIMKVGVLKYFRLILFSIEKVYIVLKIVVLFKLENGLECLWIF